MTDPLNIIGLSAAEEKYGRAGRRVRRLAVFGPRGSGKTCYFASLYGHSADGGAAITFDDESTQFYLERCWAAYKSAQGFPAPTASETPERLQFHVAEDERDWDMEILDHAGVLAERQAGRSEDDLRAIFNDWLRGCEGVIVFLDTGKDNSETALERRDEVARLLELLREEAEGRRVGRPLILALTKWDEHGSRDPEYVMEYLENNPRFRQIWKTIQLFGKRAKVYPVSALGPNRKPNAFPTHPYNLIPPLLWLLTQTDELRFEAAERQARGLPSKRAAALFARLVEDAGIIAGPVHDRIVCRQAELLARRRRGVLRTLLIAGVGLGLCALLGRTAWVRAAESFYNSYASFCESAEGQGDEKAGIRADHAEAILSWHSPVLSDEQCDRLRADRLRDREAERDHNERVAWLSLDAAWEGLNGLDPPQRLISFRQLEEGLVSFGRDHGGRKIGQQWQARLMAVRDGLSVTSAMVEEFDQARAEDRHFEAAEDYAGAVRVWQAYLRKDPSSYFARRASEALESRKRQSDDETIRLFRKRTAFGPHTVEQCLTHLELAAEARKALFESARSAGILDRSTNKVLQDADRFVYEQAQKALRDAKASRRTSALLAAHIAVKSYLTELELRHGSGFRRTPVMAAEARRAMEWLDGFVSGRTYPITYRTLFVPKGAHVYDSAGIYGVELNGVVKDDTRKRGRTSKDKCKFDELYDGVAGVIVDLSQLQPASQVGLSFAPGQTDGLSVVLHGWDFLDWNSLNFGQVLDNSYFIPAELEAGIRLVDKGRVMVLTIDCGSEAKIPELPNYRSVR